MAGLFGRFGARDATGTAGGRGATGAGAPSRSGAGAGRSDDVPLLELRRVACGYGARRVLSGISFAVPAGGVRVMLGPNGVGKSTLFKTVLGFLPVLEGEVLLDGGPIGALSRRDIARVVAYVPQVRDIAFGYTVREMVLMGRTPTLATGSSPGRDDEDAADAVIERLRLEPLAGRDVTELSGGEQQMVLIARALAAEPRLLMMDEPCANLDLGNQTMVLARVAALAETGIAVLMTSHDPNHALALGARALCVGRDGSLVERGAADLLAGSALSELYGIEIATGTLRSASGRSVSACAPVPDASSLVAERFGHPLSDQEPS